MNRGNTLLGRIAIKLASAKKEHPVLGRWAIDSCDKKTNAKIDMSNEDHCGPCGQYNLTTPVPMVEADLTNKIENNISHSVDRTHVK